MSRPIGRRESFTVKQVEAALRRGAGIESHAAEAMLKMVSGAGNPALAFSHFASGLSQSDLAALRKSLEN